MGNPIRECNDCAIRWCCSLESDGPPFIPCELHATAMTELVQAMTELVQPSQETQDEATAKAVNDLVEPPAPPKPPTRKEWGKIMRTFFTVQHGELKRCGHKLGVVEYDQKGKPQFFIREEPHNNCEDCWFSFFNENSDMVATADRCFAEEGEPTLVRIRGKKFTKNFKKFMSTMTRFRQELAEQAEAARKEADGSGQVNTSGIVGVTDAAEAGGVVRPYSEANLDESEVGSTGLGERSDQQAVQD